MEKIQVNVVKWSRSRKAVIFTTQILSPLLIVNTIHLLVHCQWIPTVIEMTAFIVLLARLRATWGEMTALWFWNALALFLIPLATISSHASDTPYDGSILSDTIFCIPLGPISALIGMATRRANENRKMRQLRDSAVKQ